jgi:hypothetical protein
MVVVVALGIEWCAEYAAIQESKTNPNFRRIGNYVIRTVTDKTSSLWNPSEWKTAAEYSAFWASKHEDMRQKMLDLRVTPNSNFVRTAIVHFRCSDVPFINMPEYPLQPRAYFKFVADFLRKYDDVDNVVVVNCNEHGKHQLAPLCHKYAHVIQEWLQGDLPQMPVDVNLACETQKETFEAMLGSHTLISTGGSFSFVPGMLKGKRFVTPYLGGLMRPYHRELHRLVHWTMWESNAPVQAADYERFDYAAQ